MSITLIKIIRFIIIILFLQFIIAINLPVCCQYPSDSAQITLLTASPGPEIYELYGHSSIWVNDPSKGMDIVYNFGVFDFDTPNFTLKFVNGRLMYQLAKASFDRFINSYNETGQTMFQQKLNLTNHEKWQLITNLETNYLPENRYYRYDFFHDNCATRIRDIIAKSVDGKIAYDSTYIKKRESFRDLIIFYQKVDPWLDFGTHLLIGSDADSIAKITDYMFLPEHMMKIYEHTKIVNDGTVRSLTQPTVVLLQGNYKPVSPTPFTSPLVVLGLLFIVVLEISFAGYKKNRHNKIIDQIILFLTGIVGLLILLVWMGSAHEVLSRNYNIIWANPISLAFAVFLFLKSQPKWFFKACLIYGLALIVFMLASFFIPQKIPAAAYFIIGILMVRLIKIGLFSKT